MEEENLPKWEDITEYELGKLVVEYTKYELMQMYGINKKDIDKKLKEFGITKFNSWYYDEDFKEKIDKILNKHKEDTSGSSKNI